MHQLNRCAPAKRRLSGMVLKDISEENLSIGRALDGVPGCPLCVEREMTWVRIHVDIQAWANGLTNWAEA